MSTPRGDSCPDGTAAVESAVEAQARSTAKEIARRRAIVGKKIGFN